MANITLEIQAGASGASNAVDTLIERMTALSTTLDNIADKARSAFTPFQNPNIGGLDSVNQRLDEISARLDEISRRGPVGFTSTATAVSSAAKSASKATGMFGKLTKSLGRIAVYRILRVAIKQLAQAFKEGLANAEAFSKLHGGPLASAMDNIR